MYAMYVDFPYLLPISYCLLLLLSAAFPSASRPFMSPPFRLSGYPARPRYRSIGAARLTHTNNACNIC